MAYITEEARRELLDDVAEAADQLGLALADLGAAYEQLDEQTGDRLEEQLFRPVQTAYGRAQRTHAAFASRHDLPAREFEPVTATAVAQGARSLIELAVEAVRRADDGLTELQDSMRPVEVGDAELRAGLAEVRELAGALPERARTLLRTLGR